MFYDNLLQLCADHNTTPTTVAKILHLSTGSPTAWKRGAVPQALTLQKIADYFNISTDQLLKGTPSHLHREQGEKIAVLSTVGAGIPLEAINTFDQDDPDSWEEISRIDARKGRFFALRIRGNSMEPEVKHGDIVIVRLSEDFDDGDMVIALVNGNEGVCKILKYRDDGIALCSLNDEYQPMQFTRDEIAALPVRLIGVVEEVRHKINRRR